MQLISQIITRSGFFGMDGDFSVASLRLPDRLVAGVGEFVPLSVSAVANRLSWSRVMRVLFVFLFAISASSLLTASALAASSLSTSFEPPDYSLGNLQGQQGWSVSGGGTTAT